MRRDFKTHVSRISTGSCPCRGCNKRYVGCHGKCLDYIDWKQAHDAQLQEIYEKKELDNILYNSQLHRHSSLKQDGGYRVNHKGGTQHDKTNR